MWGNEEDSGPIDGFFFFNLNQKTLAQASFLAFPT